MPKLLQNTCRGDTVSASLHACTGQLVVTESPQPPERSWKSVLVHASCAFCPFRERECRTARHRNPPVQPACPSLCGFTVAQVRSLKITLKTRTRQFGLRYRLQFAELVIRQSAHALFRHKRRSSVLLYRRTARRDRLLWTLCLTADAADPPHYPSLPAFLATGRPLTWGGQGRIDPGRSSADERGAEVKPGCVRAETIPS